MSDKNQAQVAVLLKNRLNKLNISDANIQALKVTAGNRMLSGWFWFRGEPKPFWLGRTQSQGLQAIDSLVIGYEYQTEIVAGVEYVKAIRDNVTHAIDNGSLKVPNQYGIYKPNAITLSEAISDNRLRYGMCGYYGIHWYYIP